MPHAACRLQLPSMKRPTGLSRRLAPPACGRQNLIYGGYARLTAAGARLPTSDLLIACTALLRGDDVLTGTPRHFRRVPALTVHDYA